MLWYCTLHCAVYSCHFWDLQFVCIRISLGIDSRGPTIPHCNTDRTKSWYLHSIVPAITVLPCTIRKCYKNFYYTPSSLFFSLAFRFFRPFLCCFPFFTCLFCILICRAVLFWTPANEHLRKRFPWPLTHTIRGKEAGKWCNWVFRSVERRKRKWLETKHIIFPGGTPISKGWGCSSGIFVSTPKRN